MNGQRSNNRQTWSGPGKNIQKKDPPGTIPEYIEMLEGLANKTGLIKNASVRSSLYWLSVKWNPRLARSLFEMLLLHMPEENDIDEFFEFPGMNDLHGELVLGGVYGYEVIEFAHLIEKLPLHTLAVGTSGSGKTNLSKILIEQAYLAGVNSIKVSDPKAEYADIAKKYPDFLLLNWSDLYFNPFLPPPNVPINEWHQSVIGHLAQALNFWEAAQSLFLKLLDSFTQQMNNGNSDKEIDELKIPNVIELLNRLNQYKPRYKQKDYMVMATVSSRLEMLFNTFRESILTKKSVLPFLIDRHCIIQTHGLNGEIESWLLEFLLLWEYMYRLYNPDHRELILHIYDECQHRLFSSEKERNIKKISSSVISTLVDEARALNIGICSLSQEPSSLIKAILNNSWMKIVFHLGSGAEVSVMQESLGLKYEQTEVLHELETGEAIVRMAGGYMKAFPVKINEFISPESVNEYEFLEEQNTMKEELYQEAGLSRIAEEKGFDKHRENKASYQESRDGSKEKREGDTQSKKGEGGDTKQQQDVFQGSEGDGVEYDEL